MLKKNCDMIARVSFTGLHRLNRLLAGREKMLVDRRPPFTVRIHPDQNFCAKIGALDGETRAEKKAAV